MTLLETLYRHLRHNELTANAEHFSTEYLNKSKSWYAVQMHERREISAAAAIQCLRSIRIKLATIELTDNEIDLLKLLEQRLAHHLLSYYGISDVVDGIET